MKQRFDETLIGSNFAAIWSRNISGPAKWPWEFSLEDGIIFRYHSATTCTPVSVTKWCVLSPGITAWYLIQQPYSLRQILARIWSPACHDAGKTASGEANEPLHAGNLVAGANCGAAAFLDCLMDYLQFHKYFRFNCGLYCSDLSDFRKKL